MIFGIVTSFISQINLGINITSNQIPIKHDLNLTLALCLSGLFKTHIIIAKTIPQIININNENENIKDFIGMTFGN